MRRPIFLALFLESLSRINILTILRHAPLNTPIVGREKCFFLRTASSGQRDKSYDLLNHRIVMGNPTTTAPFLTDLQHTPLQGTRSTTGSITPPTHP